MIVAFSSREVRALDGAAFVRLTGAPCVVAAALLGAFLEIEADFGFELLVPVFIFARVEGFCCEEDGEDSREVGCRGRLYGSRDGIRGTRSD